MEDRRSAPRAVVAMQLTCEPIYEDDESKPPNSRFGSGLTAALARTRTSHLVALGVDMPFVTAAQLQDLYHRANAGCGVVPTIGGRAEPLAAVYPVEAYVDFIAALAGNDWSLQPLVKHLADEGKVQLVNVAGAEAELYRSLNEPQDLTLRRLWARRR